jgi:hypothetical protein
MALMINVINRDEMIQSNQMNKYLSVSTSTNPQGGQTFSYLRNPAWYIADYSLNIITRRLDDMMQIIEQICPQFQPHQTLNINLISSIGLRITLPLTIEPSISFDIDEDFDEDSLRYINVEIPIRVQIPLFPPIQNSAIIKDIHTRFGTINGEDGSYIYQLQEFFRWRNDNFITEASEASVDVTETITRA